MKNDQVNDQENENQQNFTCPKSLLQSNNYFRLLFEKLQYNGQSFFFKFNITVKNTYHFCKLIVPQ